MTFSIIRYVIELARANDKIFQETPAIQGEATRETGRFHFTTVLTMNANNHNSQVNYSSREEKPLTPATSELRCNFVT